MGICNAGYYHIGNSDIKTQCDSDSAAGVAAGLIVLFVLIAICVCGCAGGGWHYRRRYYMQQPMVQTTVYQGPQPVYAVSAQPYVAFNDQTPAYTPNALPPGWREEYSNGKPYYTNVDGRSQWEYPA